MLVDPLPLSPPESDSSTGDPLERTKHRYAAVEPDVQAFVEEPNRWERIRITLSDSTDSTATSPLSTVPVGIKDIFHVDGLPTRAGSSIPAPVLTGEEGSAVRRLRAAGAVILGKTVTTEFAYFDPGPTRNPWNTNHTPGGSSSGSAAAVAAGMCPVALGTQTIGSVIRPAAFCGVVGVKPSYDRIPRDGLLPLAPSVDHVGYFTADVPSAAAVAPILYDTWDPVDGVDVPPRIGVVSGPYLDQAAPDAREAFHRDVSALETAGYSIFEVDPFESIEELTSLHHDLVAIETAESVHPYVESYEDHFSNILLELIARGRKLPGERLQAARSNRQQLRQKIHAVMDTHELSVLCSPSAPGPAPEGIDATGDPCMNLPWTHAGLPTVTIPAPTRLDGLPLGFQCTSRFMDDELLFSLVEGIESRLAQI